MTIQSRTSLVHWAVVVVIVGIVTALAWLPIMFVVAMIFPEEWRLAASLVATLAVPGLLLPAAIRSVREARWLVDAEGLESPAIGRISFSEVVSIHVGYPRSESISMAVFQSVLARGSRDLLDETLVLRFADGRLLPLNLLSPSIKGGQAVMAKVEELLVGKRHPSGDYSTPEIAVLRNRPINRFVVPAKPANVSFRRVDSAGVNDAYSAYLGVFEWLKAKGVRQWLRAIPLEVFMERQRKGELFACFVDDRLAAVVTLAFEQNPYWVEETGNVPQWWIKSLAVVRTERGTGVGARVMRESEAVARQAGAAALFLDCVDTGFLPGYYTRLGYEALARKDITYPSGNTFPVVLMKTATCPSR